METVVKAKAKRSTKGVSRPLTMIFSINEGELKVHTVSRSPAVILKEMLKANSEGTKVAIKEIVVDA